MHYPSAPFDHSQSFCEESTMAIQGEWWNELGSKMSIEVDPGDSRQLFGHYHTNVGQAQEKSYPLTGRCDISGHPDQLVSWVVVWDPPDPPEKPTDPPRLPSITAWAGQYHVEPNTGLEFLVTTWLLTRLTAASDDWKSTLVSMDFFFRVRPSSEMIEIARSLGKAASHFTPPISAR